MEKGSPLVANHAPWPILNSVSRRLKALWTFILLIHLLSGIFIIALVVPIYNTVSDSNNNSSNMDLILAKFPFPPPTTSAYPFHSVNPQDHASNLSKRWGHFDCLPTTPKCYRQERTAALLCLFCGLFGADQLYAGNLRLGLTRLLLHIWVWCSVIVAWIISGANEMDGNGSLRVKIICEVVGVLGIWTEWGVWIWAIVDLVRWIIGGYYGTRVCPV